MMAGKSPSVVIVAGPNEAGKSLTAPSLLRGALAMTESVDAATIAQGLSVSESERTEE